MQFKIHMGTHGSELWLLQSEANIIFVESHCNPHFHTTSSLPSFVFVILSNGPRQIQRQGPDDVTDDVNANAMDRAVRSLHC